MSSKRQVFIRGALAMAAGLAIAFAASAIYPRVAYPPARIAALLVNATPGGFATRMIESLGHGALRSLSFGVNVGVVAAGGFLALWICSPGEIRSRALRALLLGGAVYITAAGLSLTAPEGLTIAGAIVYLVSSYAFARYSAGVPLSHVLSGPRVREGERPVDAINRSRRRFIVRALLIVGGVAAGGVYALRSAVTKVADELRIASADRPFVPPPEDPDFPAVKGLTKEITSNAEFYNVDINIVKPSVDVDRWKLRIHGLFAEEFELDYKSLQEDFEIVELAHTLTCISNEIGGDLISTAVWRGVRLKDVLNRARVNEDVVDIVFRGAEGYSDSIPLKKAMEETTLVVFGMNGVALPREHGFPARIIVPGIYGMKNVKWLTEIEAVDNDYQGYWMVRGWSDEAIIKTGSRIDVPFDTAEVSGNTKVAGIAWAGDRGIHSVEVSQDGGQSWGTAKLKRPLSDVSWRLWTTDLHAVPGKRKILVRAKDGKGSLQTSRVTKPHPDGASGYDAVVVDAVE